MSLTPRRAACVASATTLLIVIASLPVAAADLGHENASPPEAPADASFDQNRFGGVQQTLSNWHVVVGAGVMYRPKYEGSKEMDLLPVPMISATFGDRLHLDPSGLTLDAIKADGLTLAIKGGYEIGRKEDDSDHLRGLGDIGVGGVIGARASYEFGPARLYANIDKTIGGSDGLVGKFGADVTQQYDKFIFSLGASATVADDKHMQSYFGVTSEQSARSGLKEYEAKAGLKRFDADASVTYMVTDNWLVRSQVGVGFLTGDARNSPIVEKSIQPSAMLTIGYKF